MPNSSSTAVAINHLTHRYKGAAAPALDDLSLEVRAGGIFGLLGPNGGGKTTLFRILATLLSPSSGACEIFGDDVLRNPAAVRRSLGVVFQSPSLDKKLTVLENMLQQGHLYGLSGAPLRMACDTLLERFGLTAKRKDTAETLSGGLKRRVELAKSLLHKPRLLLLDEPSTGLDPAARRELSDYLAALRKQDGITVLLTTHIMEEAQACDRLAIIDRGKISAIGSPDALKEEVGGDVISVTGKYPAMLSQQIAERFSLQTSLLDDVVRIEKPRGHEFVAQLVEAFPGQIQTVSVGKPTLEDVFIHKTGHRL